MDLNEINENWQKDAPTLAAMEKKNPFSVPEGYFEEMKTQLQSRITIHKFDNNTESFVVPQNYFDTLSDKITSRAKLEELKNEPQFEIPENYFNTLEAKIRTRIDESEGNVPVKRLILVWTKYAAAACITAIISFGIYFNTRSNSIETQIAQLPAEDIVDYLQLYSDVGDAPVIINNIDNTTSISEIDTEISDAEIENYLELNL